jgi:drug/metabolite transporter (DMT)-like permease
LPPGYFILAMLYLALSVLLSVVLLLNFRLFPRFGVNTVQAIVLNYPVCFGTGLLLLPRGQSVTLDFGLAWTWPALALGLGFIVTFLLSGASTQRSGITATSLANNLSLVIPVGFSLFIFGTAPTFDGWNYLGLALALVAVGLSTWKGGEGQEGEKREEGEEREKGEKREGKKSLGRVNWGALLPLAVFGMYGLTNTTISYINLRYITAPDQVVGVTLVMVLGAVVSGLVLLAFRLVRGQERLDPRNLLAAVTLGVPNFLSFYTLQLGLSALGNNGALVYPLYNIGVILLAGLVAYLFFREKLLTVNRIGLGLAVLAIALISWQSLARLLP